MSHATREARYREDIGRFDETIAFLTERGEPIPHALAEGRETLAREARAKGIEIADVSRETEPHD